MPRSRIGKWAGGLLVVFIVLLVSVMVGVGKLQGTPLGITIGACTMAGGIATFVTGVVGLAKFKDRSFVVILAVVVGALAIVAFGFEVTELVVGLVGS